MTEGEFITAVTDAIRRSSIPGQSSRTLLQEMNTEFGVNKAVEIGPGRFQEYLDKLAVRLVIAPRDTGGETENPDKKREGDSALKTCFSLHHLNLAYWMGRTLGDGSRVLEDWQGAVFSVCGQHVPMGDLTEAQCRAVLIASGLFDHSNLPQSTAHMTQRMN